MTSNYSTITLNTVLTRAPRRLTKSNASLALFGVIALILAQPVRAAAGRTPGSFTVSPTGEATYTVPIWVPPGPKGMQPNLAIIYNSRNEGSDLGVGWSLAGLSAITRCEQTVAQDGASAQIKLDYTDTFCLNDNRLRVTSGVSTYGYDQSTYQTELADFSLVTAYGVAGSGPAYFVVQTKDGHRYEYGNSSNSRIIATPQTTALRWLLNKVTDPDGNNYIVSYSSGVSSQNIGVPQTISYTPSTAGASTYNYTVNFAYTADTANGTESGFVAGIETKDSNLLTSIVVKSGANTVRNYVLAYELAPITSRNRLHSITECADASGTDCLSPTTISYSNGQAGIGASPTTAVSTNSILTSTRDINGDRRADLLYYEPGTSSVKVVFATASGFTTPVTVTSSYAGGTGTIAVGDVLGNGKPDVFAAINGVWWRFTYSSGSNSFSGASTGLSAPTGAFRVALQDINGDGLDDLVYAVRTISGITRTITVYTVLNASSGNAVNAAYTKSLGCPLIYPNCSLDLRARSELTSASPSMDFNGDQRQDLLLLTNQSGEDGLVTTATVLLSNGNGLFTAGAVISDGYYSAAADANNDGCTDLVTDYIASLSACNGQVASWVGSSLPMLGTIDWDGDGRTDILVYNGGYLAIQPATGGSLITTAIPAASSASYPYNPQFAVADFDGDGQRDFASWDTSGIYYRLHNFAGVTGGAAPADAVTAITDGLGVATTVLYASTAKSNYSGDGTPASGQTVSTDPTLVVAQVTSSDGIGGTFTKTFTYSGAMQDLQGRGFQGFQTVTVSDSRTDATLTKTYYKTEFPYTGMMYQRDIYQHDGTTLISHTTVTPGTQSLGPTADRHFIFAASMTTENHEVAGSLNGQLITTQSTTNTYSTDGFGNLLNTTTTITDNDPYSPYSGLSWSTTTTNTISASSTYWCLGLPTQVSIDNTAPGASALTRTTTYTPDYAKCRVTGITTGNGSTQVDQGFGFDAFGNINNVTVTGRNSNGTLMASRATGINWGSSGQFPMQVTNALNQPTTFNYDFDKGTRSSAMDPNGLQTTWQSDSFARLQGESRPDGTSTGWTYIDCIAASQCINANNKLNVLETVYNVGGTVQRSSATNLDAFERVLAVSAPTMTGLMSKTERLYDALGRVAHQSAPCNSASCTQYWTDFTYDALDRQTVASRPINAGNTSAQYTNTYYEGRTVRVVDPLGKQTTKIYKVTGDLGVSRDHNGYNQSFGHDAFGSVVVVNDNVSSSPLFTASYSYGIRAFQTSASDPDRGAFNYAYDSLGELTSYQNVAKSQTTDVTYDALSRPLTRTEPDMTTEWTWGTSSSEHNIGQLKTVTSNAYSESYAYDNLSRRVTKTVTSDAAYTYGYSYNATTGLLDTLTYPQSTNCVSVKLKYAYQYGQLSQIQDDTNNTAGIVYWQANATSAFGSITQETFGNGVVRNRSIDAVTGWLNSLQAGVGGGTGLQNMSFLHDKVGNVTQRQNGNPSLTENFYYDNVYRLDYSQLGGTTNLDVNYDAQGNITSRSDVASGAVWTYDTSKRHAVLTAGSNTYSYDDNGNMSSRNGSFISWTSANYPQQINSASETLLFMYGPNHQRIRQVYGSAAGSEDTEFIGEALEKTTLVDGTSDWRHYVYANGQPIAVISRRSDGTNAVRYLLDDQQGSTAVIADAGGSALVKESYTAFGNGRDPSTWSGTPSTADQALIASLTRRGYTFHTNLGSPQLGLIHMNGRVQDAITGRFLSPDPYVTEPGNTQNYNRYSYVNNNPVSFVDPSGYQTQTYTGTRIPGVVPNFLSCLGNCGGSGSRGSGGGFSGGADGEGGGGGVGGTVTWCPEAGNCVTNYWRYSSGGEGSLWTVADVLSSLGYSFAQQTQAETQAETQGNQRQNWVCSKQGKAVISSAVGGAVTTGIYSGGNPLAMVGGAAVGGSIAYAADRFSAYPNLSPAAQGVLGAVDESPRGGGMSAFVTGVLTSNGIPSQSAGAVGGAIYGALQSGLGPNLLPGVVKGGFAGWAGAFAADWTSNILDAACAP